MKYDKYTILTTEEAEDILAAELMELGAGGVEIEDNSIPDTVYESGVFHDVLPESGLKEGTALVTFYVEEGTPRQEILSRVSEMISRLRETVPVGDGGISVSATEDKDWLNSWKEFFHQFTIDFEDGRRALFVPSWEKPGDVGDVDFMIRIDPGTAFGTGTHETTRLAIRALEKHVKSGMRFLDVGTGSGILSMLSFLFGAESGVGTDLDPCVESAVEDNFSANSLSDRDFTLYLGNLLTDEALREKIGQGYDIVAANILADVLQELTPLVPGLLKKGGKFILSGIIDFRAEEVRRCLEETGFTILEEEKDGEWVGITATL